MDAYVLLRTEPGRTRDAAERLTRLAGDGIRQVVVITGDWDVLVALDVADPHQLGEVVMGQVLDDETITESQTSVVLNLPARDPKPTPKPKPKPMPVRGRDPFVALVFADLDLAPGRESSDGWDTWLGGVMDSVAEAPGVAGVAVLTGEYDLLIEVGGATWDECSKGILSIATIPGIAATTTAVAVTEKLVPTEAAD
jgi:DNA-binding Lrp family transcriptional regulator